MFKILHRSAARACVAAIFGLTALSAGATTYTVSGTISAVENYGTQFSVFLAGGAIPGNACGAPRDRFAVSLAVSGADQYKVFVAQLLATYVAKKTVTLTVDDAQCSGDRPTISYFKISG